MSVRCSIIIRCYNEAAHLPRLLYGISQQSLRAYEIIAVDSGPTDETVPLLAPHGLKILPLPPPAFSFARSRQPGAGAARGGSLKRGGRLTKGSEILFGPMPGEPNSTHSKSTPPSWAGRAESSS